MAMTRRAGIPKGKKFIFNGAKLTTEQTSTFRLLSLRSLLVIQPFSQLPRIAERSNKIFLHHKILKIIPVKSCPGVTTKSHYNYIGNFTRTRR